MIEIIPAIDIIEGKCVRLYKGDYGLKTEYEGNPSDIAKKFEDAGFRRLHLVDLEGAAEQKVVNHKTLEKIALATNLKIDFSGGIKSDEEIRKVFDYGASMASIGTLAVKNKPLFEEWLKKYKEERIILSADVKNEEIAVYGWKENTRINLFDFLNEYSQMGIKYVICSDINKDGTFQGLNMKLYEKIKEKFPSINLIASGGLNDISEIEYLDSKAVYAVIAGKSLYEERIKIKDLSLYLKK